MLLVRVSIQTYDWMWIWKATWLLSAPRGCILNLMLWLVHGLKIKKISFMVGREESSLNLPSGFNLNLSFLCLVKFEWWWWPSPRVLCSVQVVETNSPEEEAQREARSFCADLRRLQQRNKCTNATCEDICSTFAKYLKMPAPDFRACDKKMKQQAGVHFLRLNGCPKCHQHVYVPEDRSEICPHVHANGNVCGHSRFDENHKAWEVRRWF